MDKKNKNPNVPNLRFNNDPYKKYNLYEFATRVTRKNKDNFSNLPLTISAQYGLVDQVSFFNKTVASKDMSGYYLLKNGEFAYNKSYSNDYPWGAIKRLDLYDMGCLSTLYICFKPNDNIVNSNYLAHYFESPKWHKQVADIAGEGARNHGLLNIAVNDFFNTKHAVPTIENQIKIAKFLDLIEARIQTQSKIIDDYSSVKDYIIKDYFQKCREYIDLGNSFKYGKAGGTPKSSNKEYYDGDIPFLGIADITSQGKYINHTSKSLTQKGLINSSAWLVPKNSLILSMYASVGLPTINKIPLATSQAMMSMIFEDELDVEFVYYYLCYFKKNKIRSLLETGAQSNINADTVKSIKVPKLKADEKERITNIFIKIDQLINNEKQILNLLQKQKNFLLKNMFV